MPLIHRNVAAGSAITESASVRRCHCAAAARTAAVQWWASTRETRQMDNLSFGMTMTIVGVGGTFLTLWILSLVVDLLKKFFPLQAQDEAEKKA